MDFIKEKLEDVQEEFELIKDARATIWMRHDLTRHKRSEIAASSGGKKRKPV